ncbi:tetratricopeptide repeat protein [Nocardia aurea]|uniref:Tetratricopeptide repeat protein n=1 Tax=Nocardia aurea TaxID=2144174 RepID=A0ABV3FRW6_9NOCA
MTRLDSSQPERTPRSPILEGLLGTAEVIAWALVLELGRNVVISSFGENATVKAIGGALRGLAIMLVLIAGSYVAYRRTAGLREQRRADRELAMVAGLADPGDPVAGGRVGGCPGPPRELAHSDDDKTAAVLRHLPVGEFETAALLAVLTAILEAPDRLPRNDPPSTQRTAHMLLAELCVGPDSILEHLGSDRYCVRRVPRDSGLETVVADEKWWAAMPALVGHYADHATRWAIALELTPTAGAARRWFEAKEPYLREILVGCTKYTFAQHISFATACELVRISDALDVWYTRTESVGRLEMARRLRFIEALKELPLIRLRGNLPPTGPGNRPLVLSSSLSARWKHQVAVRRLSTAQANQVVSTSALPEAERELKAAWWLLPRADVAGQVCALINLAIVHTHQGRLAAAQDRLELAESLTESGRDPGGRAHTHEILGALCWARGENVIALRYWQRALGSYLTLADDRGTGRCLQHLGSAMVVAPDYGSHLLPPRLSSTHHTVVRQASGWLAEARRLNPSVGLVGYYADKASAELRTFGPVPESRGALSAIDHWPLLDSEQRNR